ncbi:MAG: diaminopimelate decarboxylase [Phycisphaerae bacterium]|nr:diaminopimelate decarboxylase [Phycisphaerae bacterium]
MTLFIEETAGGLRIDGLDADALAAEFGTPLYVYSAGMIRANFLRLASAFAALSPLLCYALKACGNLHICRLLAAKDAGMDVVSGGELERAWLSGVPMSRVVFAGVGKTEAEIRAALDGRFSPFANPVPGAPDPRGRGPVGLFNIESEGEFLRIASIAEQLGIVASACLRINPDVDARTHKYTTTGKYENKFGIEIGRAAEFFASHGRTPHLRLTGLHIHLGSPIATPAPYLEAVRIALSLIDRLADAGTPISVLNIGGGYGIDYGGGGVCTPEEFGAALVPELALRVAAGLRIIMEPGRIIVGNAGVLLTRVQYIKTGKSKRFIIGDAGIHTLLRPALYGAHHRIRPTRVAPNASESPADVVGPVCESSDFLCQDRPMPPVSPGDLLAVFDAGAYGMSMASTYNDHPKPAEVLADAGRAALIRPRGDIAGLIAPELACDP